MAKRLHCYIGVITWGTSLCFSFPPSVFKCFAAWRETFVGWNLQNPRGVESVHSWDNADVRFSSEKEGGEQGGRVWLPRQSLTTREGESVSTLWARYITPLSRGRLLPAPSSEVQENFNKQESNPLPRTEPSQNHAVYNISLQSGSFKAGGGEIHSAPFYTQFIIFGHSGWYVWYVWRKNTLSNCVKSLAISPLATRTSRYREKIVPTLFSSPSADFCAKMPFLQFAHNWCFLCLFDGHKIQAMTCKTKRTRIVVFPPLHYSLGFWSIEKSAKADINFLVVGFEMSGFST